MVMARAPALLGGAEGAGLVQTGERRAFGGGWNSLALPRCSFQEDIAVQGTRTRGNGQQERLRLDIGRNF